MNELKQLPINLALTLKNWSKGGNNYVLKGGSSNRWCGYEESVIKKLIASFNDNFYIVIHIDDQIEHDYYCIPFTKVKHLFKPEFKTKGKYPDRWTSTIIDNKFSILNSHITIDVTEYYSCFPVTKSKIEFDDDYFIEDAKAQIKIRLGQSKFRKEVLKNYDYKCALTAISDEALLTASHIIPWSHKKEFRADVANGICLYTEIDSLFDKGYISFTNDLKVLITQKNGLCKELEIKLKSLEGKQLRAPKTKNLNLDYLEYHRSKIFIKK